MSARRIAARRWALKPCGWRDSPGRCASGSSRSSTSATSTDPATPGSRPKTATGLCGATPALEPSWVRELGVRSVDAGEKRFLHEQGLEVFDMRYVDEMGMRQTMEQALAGLDSGTHLHVSFDVDFLDPEIAPGVGTRVPG